MTKWWHLGVFGACCVLGACGEVVLGSFAAKSQGGQAGMDGPMDGGIAGYAGAGGGAGNSGGGGGASGNGGSTGEAGSMNLGGMGTAGTGEPPPEGEPPLYKGPTPTSCLGLDATCGDAESCCSTDWVPGGRFTLGVDNPDGNPEFAHLPRGLRGLCDARRSDGSQPSQPAALVARRQLGERRRRDHGGPARRRPSFSRRPFQRHALR